MVVVVSRGGGRVGVVVVVRGVEDWIGSMGKRRLWKKRVWIAISTGHKLDQMGRTVGEGGGLQCGVLRGSRR